VAFFTWHGSKDDLLAQIKILHQHKHHLRLNIVCGSEANFLDVHMENDNGRLYTNVHHKLTTQPYVLPYVFGHAQVIYSNWLRAALVRAARYCSSVRGFDQERIYIEMTFLVNGYSLEFVRSRIKQFFFHYDVTVLNLNLDQVLYDTLRRRVFRQIDQEQYLFEKNQTFKDSDHYYQAYYLFEWGPRRQFNKDFNELWIKFVKESRELTSINAKMVFQTKHQHSLNALLARQKPSLTTTVS
jgi:hypothetical protein